MDIDIALYLLIYENNSNFLFVAGVPYAISYKLISYVTLQELQ